jgi:peptidoglycan/LPS O-acetylase OafA/YrhL
VRVETETFHKQRFLDFRGGFIVSYFNRACISLACFAIGWMLCSVNTRPHAVVGWLLAIGAFASMMFPPIVATGRPSIELCYLVAFTGAVFCLAPVKMPHMAQQIARFFGETSYGIYLWHFPLFRVLHPNTLLKSAIFLAVLLLLSWASYRFFDRPMMLALRTRLRSSATVDGLRSA